MIEPPVLVPPARELEPHLGDARLFSGQESIVYMNHAGLSPASAVVRRAVANMLVDYGKRGAAAYPTWMAQRDRLRGKLAALVGVTPSEVALTQNTSRGIGDVAMCMSWRPGDRVVIFDGEFPANVIPWLRAAELFSLEVVQLDGHRFLSEKDALLTDLRAELAKGGVRMVAVSAVQFQTGLKTPLAAIGTMCRKAGARFFVDGVQACGLTQVDVPSEKIDFLACGAHKWLMGIEGAGFVVATSDAVRDLVPRTVSWLSYEEPVDFLFEGPGHLRYDKPPRSTIAFLESANVSAASFVALEAALDLILKLGREVVFDHVQRIHDRLEPAAIERGLVSLRSPDLEGRSGSLCFLPPADVEAKDLYRELGALGIACAIPDGRLRFSPHWWTAVDEADQVAWAIEQSLAKIRTGASRPE